MKKIIIAIITLLSITACYSDSENCERVEDDFYCSESGVMIVDIEHQGHKFIYFKAGYSGNALHSPDCPCMKEK